MRRLSKYKRDRDGSGTKERNDDRGKIQCVTNREASTFLPILVEISEVQL
jgi:hypothetical protein